nr:hypothetical protein [uncultured Lachnoclostridium sp.]
MEKNENYIVNAAALLPAIRPNTIVSVNGLPVEMARIIGEAIKNQNFMLDKLKYYC